jgi:hypothetical protein
MWRMGGQAMSLAIEGNMHEIVVLGIGHLKRIGPMNTLELNTNYPIYLCEPLVILCLSSFFQRHSWTMNQAWVTDAFHIAHKGFTIEEAVLLVLFQELRGKLHILSDIFH